MLIFIARVERCIEATFLTVSQLRKPCSSSLTCLVYNEYRIVTVVMHTSIDKKYNYDKNDNYI